MQHLVNKQRYRDTECHLSDIEKTTQSKKLIRTNAVCSYHNYCYKNSVSFSALEILTGDLPTASVKIDVILRRCATAVNWDSRVDWIGRYQLSLQLNTSAIVILASRLTEYWFTKLKTESLLLLLLLLRQSTYVKYLMVDWSSFAGASHHRCDIIHL